MQTVTAKAQTKMERHVDEYDELVHAIATSYVVTDQDRRQHNQRLAQAKECGHAVLTYIRELDECVY